MTRQPRRPIYMIKLQAAWAPIQFMRCAHFSKSYFDDSAFVVCPPAKNSRTYSAATKHQRRRRFPGAAHLSGGHNG